MLDLDAPTVAMGATAVACTVWCADAAAKGPAWMAWTMGALAALNAVGAVARRITAGREQEAS